MARTFWFAVTALLIRLSTASLIDSKPMKRCRQCACSSCSTSSRDVMTFARVNASQGRPSDGSFSSSARRRGGGTVKVESIERMADAPLVSA
jgi:hypothetical protein